MMGIVGNVKHVKLQKIAFRGLFPHPRAIMLMCLSSAGGVGSKVKWLISWPLLLLLYFTVPNCAKPRWEKYFMLSFILSTLWIAIFSYFMVWMVSVVCLESFFFPRPFICLDFFCIRCAEKA